MTNPVHTTANGTKVLDPGTDNAAMIILYRGLGIESGSAYAYDTAEWVISQVKKSVSQFVLDRMILVAPFDYNQDCELCLQQAKKLIDKRGGKITSYSLCGFSRGGRHRPGGRRRDAGHLVVQHDRQLDAEPALETL